MPEDIIYQDDKVSVTTARVIITGTTYALRNVTSVKMTVVPALSGCAAIMIAVVLGIILFASLFAAFQSSELLWLIPGVGITVGGVLWLGSLKPDYDVTIASSAGEARALTSKDSGYVTKIVDAINEAFVQYR